MAVRVVIAGIALVGIAAALAQGAGTPAPIAAQPTTPAAFPEITVTAPRPPTPEELAGDAVYDFVRVHAAPTVIAGQLARWGIGREPGICPLTQGLSPGFNDFVSARILAVAAAVGAPFQSAGQCTKHNVFIVFTAQPDKALHEIAQRDPRILGFHYSQQTRDLEAIKRPIQGWYVTTTRGWHGEETIDDPEPLLPLPRDILEAGKHPAGLPGSRLSASISSAIVHVVVIADTSKLAGRAIGAVADYFAVLILAQAASPERCGTLPSILDMLVPNCGDNEKLSGVTAGDLAFLRALYKADLEAVLPVERGNIHNSMMRDFERP